jgi:hypothetical protein
MKTVIWTGYLVYRAQLRGFDLAILEEIIRFSGERYFDTITQRMLVVGSHKGQVVIIPYEEEAGNLTPITVHSITRQQINLRVQTGRFRL